MDSISMNILPVGAFVKKKWSAFEVQNDNSVLASDGLQSKPNTEQGSTSTISRSTYSLHASYRSKLLEQRCKTLRVINQHRENTREETIV